MSLHHVHKARNPRGIAILGALWLGIVVLWIVLDLSPVVAGLAMLALVPAALDIARDRRAAFDLTHETIEWRSGSQEARVARSSIDRLRLDTRLDLSLRITLWTKDGARLRLPPDAVPPARDLIPALDALGYEYERRHFAFI